MSNASVCPEARNFFNPNAGLGSAPKSGNALERWHVGHRMLFSLWSHISLVLAEMLVDQRNNDAEALREHLKLATKLFRGSSAAFSLCGGMSPDEFVQVTGHMKVGSGIPDISGTNGACWRGIYCLLKEHCEAGFPKWAWAVTPSDFADYKMAIAELYVNHRHVGQLATLDTRAGGESLAGNPITVLTGPLLDRVLALLETTGGSDDKN